MKISLLGTGLMGFPMAEQLLKSDFETVVWNRTTAKAAPFAKLGATIAPNAKDAIDTSSLIILMLSDARAIEDVLFPATSAPPLKDKTIFQMGTISPEESLTLQERINKAGGVYIEAPVLGSVPQAQERRLIIMVGATLEQFQEHEKVFRAFGSDIFWIGEVGQAAALKLALNHLIAAETAAFALSLALVRERNVDVDMFMTVLRNSALYAPTFDKKLDNYRERMFKSANFPLKWLHKDVRLMLDEAKRFKLDARALAAIEGLLADGVKSGEGMSDYSALYKIIHREKK